MFYIELLQCHYQTYCELKFYYSVLTSQEAAVAPPGWWIPLVTGKFLFFSPNLVWLAIALFDYFVFPYDFQAARSFDSLDWVYFR